MLDPDPITDRRVLVTPLPAATPSPVVLVAVVAMALIGAGAIVLIGIFAPERSALLIGQVLALLVPTTAALLAVLKSTQNSQAIQQVHLSLNGRLEQLLRVTASSQRAEGNIEGAQKMLDASNLVAAQAIVGAQVPVIIAPAPLVPVVQQRRKKDPVPPPKEQP